jgi:hypothetical protein
VVGSFVAVVAVLGALVFSFVVWGDELSQSLNQTQRERDLLRYIRLYTSKQQQASNNNCVGAAVTRYTRDSHWHRIFARLRCAGPCVADGCLAGARSSLA